MQIRNMPSSTFDWDAIPDVTAAHVAGTPYIHMSDVRLPLLCGGVFKGHTTTPRTSNPEMVTCPECIAAFSHEGIRIPPIMLPVMRKQMPPLRPEAPIIPILDTLYDALSAASENWRNEAEQAIGPDMLALMGAIMSRIEQVSDTNAWKPTCTECGCTH